jgi:hypothetical protein
LLPIPVAVFELLVLLVFIILPLAAGYSEASYGALLIPVTLIVVSVVAYVSSRPSGGQPADEVDVIPGVYLAASLAGLLLCLVGVALGRKRQETSGPPNPE